MAYAIPLAVSTLALDTKQANVASALKSTIDPRRKKVDLYA